MIKTKIYAAWCGSGKTYIDEKSNLNTVEIEYWKYKDKHKESRYVDDVKKYIGIVDYILISTDPEGLKKLIDGGLDVILVYPKNELREEYLERYIKRDSCCDFIGAFMKYWNPWLDELKSITGCQHIVLDKGEYLYDKLK